MIAEAQVAGFEETVSAPGAHKDATLHLGGHGESWEIKIIVVTQNGQTAVCVRSVEETVIPAATVREGLEIFAAQLAAEIQKLPVHEHTVRD